MDLVAFYQRILSPPPPWHVSRVECYDNEKRVDVWLEHAPSKFVASIAWLNALYTTMRRSVPGVI